MKQVIKQIIETIENIVYKQKYFELILTGLLHIFYFLYSFDKMKKYFLNIILLN